MKGILLAGGRGTRLYPITRAVSKQLLPIYDKPMFYYPLCTLMQANIRDILLITTPQDMPQFKIHLGDGSDLGINISYAEQPFALGIADALRIGRRFIGSDRAALILGDNLFIGNAIYPLLSVASQEQNAVIFAQAVEHPSCFGVVELDEVGSIVSLEEKPMKPRSNLAVPGLYFYPPDAASMAGELSPSKRGEIEITDLNRQYLAQDRLKALILNKEIHWMDTGSYSGLLEAVNLVAQLQNAQNCKIGCIEETAVRMGFIPKEKLCVFASRLHGTDYGEYLLKLARA